MPKSLRVIRRRIGVIKNIRQITKAMKMVAAAKLKRAQDKAVGSRPYLNSIFEMASFLYGYTGERSFKLLEKHDEEKKVAVLIYTSNRGLCGSFNSNMIRRAEELTRLFKKENREVILFHVGKKGYDYFRKRGYNVSKFYKTIKDSLTQEQALEIAKDLVGGYLRSDFDRVEVIVSKFHSAGMNRPQSLTLIPIELQKSDVERKIIFEPSQGDLLETLLPELVKSRIMNAILESFASEHGSRMTAMESATSNANEIIKNITLEYNKARQASITKELVEIIGGAEAQHTR